MTQGGSYAIGTSTTLESNKSPRVNPVLVDAKLAGRPGLPVEAPCHHMRVERGLEGWDELLKLLEGQAGEIQELRGASLQLDKSYTGHGWCLLSVKAQHTINRKP